MTAPVTSRRRRPESAATATLFAVLCCIGAHTPVTAQVRETLWQVTAAPPEPGPLLFFISPEGSLPRREEVHYVIAPASAGRPREFLRCDGNVRILRRIDRNTILVMSHQDDYGLFLIDLKAGTSKAIIPGNHSYFLFHQDGKLFFTERAIRAAGHSHHIGVCDELLTEDPDWLFKPAVEYQWVMDGKTKKQLLVLTANTRELWLLDLSGKGKHQKIITTDNRWHPSLTTAELSPNGKLLAFGILRSRAEPDKNHIAGAGLSKGLGAGHHLRVLDVATSKVKLEIRDIPVEISPFSSSIAKLEVTWLDDRQIRYSESGWPKPAAQTDSKPTLHRFTSMFFRFVDVDIETGRKTVYPKYAQGGLDHTKPPRGEKPVVPDLTVRYRDGLFDRHDGQIFWQNGKEAVIDRRDEKGRAWGFVQTSADGRFCLVSRWGGVMSKNKPVLLDGRTKGKLPLLDSWCYEFKWLPAAGR